MENWLAQNWLNLFGSAGIAGLWFTAISIHNEAKAQRTANHLTLTMNHRELWSLPFRYRQLMRILDGSADLTKEPVNQDEEIFVGMAIQHLNAAYHAMKSGLTVKLEGLRRDVAQFFSLPIPREVWDKIKVLQNDDFVAFVESCRNWK